MESQSAWQTSVHQLEIEQTAAGPVIHGMFLWSPPMPPPLCQGETPHCIAGSNNPTSCQPLTIPEPQVCAPNCNSNILEHNDKGSCSCLCTQTAPLSCLGCDRPGYCN